jgi:hypothetical protein
LGKQDSEIPTNIPNTLNDIEQALERHSVRCRWETNTTSFAFKMV